jgi:hypothetical protein
MRASGRLSAGQDRGRGAALGGQALEPVGRPGECHLDVPTDAVALAPCQRADHGRGQQRPRRGGGGGPPAGEQ